MEFIRRDDVDGEIHLTIMDDQTIGRQHQAITIFTNKITPVSFDSDHAYRMIMNMEEVFECLKDFYNAGMSPQEHDKKWLDTGRKRELFSSIGYDDKGEAEMFEVFVPMPNKQNGSYFKSIKILRNKAIIAGLVYEDDPDRPMENSNAR
jgi:hypothetical protein